MNQQCNCYNIYVKFGPVCVSFNNLYTVKHSSVAIGYILECQINRQLCFILEEGKGSKFLIDLFIYVILLKSF